MPKNLTARHFKDVHIKLLISKKYYQGVDTWFRQRVDTLIADTMTAICGDRTQNPRSLSNELKLDYTASAYLVYLTLLLHFSY
jgi:hypothetical protein